jgi:tripartite-type tricarboxylate transporter receptor subunit TctC
MKRSFFSLLLCVVASAFCTPAISQSYPSQSIQLVVPFPPGASTDLLARFIGPKLSEALGQPVVVENRSGAGGLIGAAYVAKSKPDGHTLLVASSTVLQSPLLQIKPAFDPVKDFAPIAAAFQHPFLMASTGNLPPRDLPELLSYAKSNPGVLNAASLGGFSDAISQMFKNAAGIDIQIVPYRGGSEAMIGVIRGDAHLVFNPYAAMRSQLQSGQLKAMAVSSLKRSPAIPDVPTFAESGMPGFEIINVVGLLAPAGTPDPILKRLNAEIARIITAPEGKEFILSSGNDTITDLSPAYYASLIRAADDKYRVVIDRIGIKKQ